MRLLHAALILLLTAGLAHVAAAQQPATATTAPADVASIPADATKDPSGLATKVLKPGTGTDHPAADEVVVVDYSGWTSDGKMFDSTAQSGPRTLTLNRLIPGLSEGIQMMVVGETRRLWIPQALAFKGQPGKPAGQVTFDVTLLAMPLRAPADVKGPPADATETRSGLYYKVLQPGAGQRHPKKIDEVVVQYTGWTTDGKMFDSSYMHDGPMTLPLDRVIAGWSEGIPLMVEGEKARFWIPEKLAYKGKNPPYGMLVFDIELIRIR
ncbi:MAG: FKBP-type peptidyl-prolyl cis-trans isomerase [Candidatus Korobacteraceae bacterium]